MAADDDASALAALESQLTADLGPEEAAALLGEATAAAGGATGSRKHAYAAWEIHNVYIMSTTNKNFK